MSLKVNEITLILCQFSVIDSQYTKIENIFLIFTLFTIVDILISLLAFQPDDFF